jgi:transposase
MIPVPSGVRVWLAVGHTDMRRGMNSLALQVQEGLKRDPHAGDLYVFRGKRGHLIKILWHDGIGMSLYAKRLERGRFLWPSPVARNAARRYCRTADGIDRRARGAAAGGGPSVRGRGDGRLSQTADRQDEARAVRAIG